LVWVTDVALQTLLVYKKLTLYRYCNTSWRNLRHYWRKETDGLVNTGRASLATNLTSYWC